MQLMTDIVIPSFFYRQEPEGLKTMFDERRKDRQEYSGDRVEYSLDPFFKGGLFEADVINVSETGLCFLSSNPLTVGQQIILSNFMSFSSQTAVVIWVEIYHDEIHHADTSDTVAYKIGLRFMGTGETEWEERQQ